MTKLKVLQVLREQAEFQSGEQLSKRLGVTRNSIWKAVCQLRKEGYAITAVTNRGYRLEQEQDLLDQVCIQEKLHTDTVGKQLVFLPVISSTNTAARKAAAEEAETGTAFLTEQQTAGRSKRGGSFYSAERGLYCSVLLRPRLSLRKLPEFGAELLGAVAESIHTISGILPEIRKPNELYVNGKKLCGMLTEVHMEAESEELAYLIVGIGIYCNNAEFPDGVQATSLRQVCGREVNRNHLLAELLNRMDVLAARFG